MRSTTDIDPTPEPPRSSGWLYVLPAGRHRRIACWDDGGGDVALAVAEIADEVVACVPVDQAQRVANRFAGHAKIRVRGESHEQAVDGVVVHLPRAGSAWEDWLVRATRSLEPWGFAYLCAHNRVPFNGLTGSSAVDARLAGSGAVSRRLGRLGLSHTTVHPLLLNEGEVRQILTPCGYRSHAGAPSGRERAKEILLGRLGSRYLASAYAGVGFVADARPSGLDEIVELAHTGVPGPAAADRVLILPEATLVAVRDADPNPRIVVVAEGGHRQQRRRREAHILQQARTLPEAVAGRIPRLYSNGQYRGRTYSVLERLEGVCVDEPVADLEVVTERLAGFLLDLHAATRRANRVDEDLYQDLVGSFVRAGMRRYPACHDRLATVDTLLREQFLGTTMPTVWMHGDFKVENAVIDRVNRTIVGVIDWELARIPGLPLLDLLYLLTYNRMLVRSCRFDQVFVDTVLPGRWNAAEESMLVRYRDAIGITGAQARLLADIFAIQALGERLHYDMGSADDREQLSGLVEAVIESLRDGVDQSHEGEAA